MARRRGIVVAASALAICLADAVPSPAPASEAASDPLLCTASETRRLVTSFVRAFNRGDVRTLNRLWARRPDFRWYTAFQSEPRVGHSVFARERLVPYFHASASARRAPANRPLSLQRKRWSPRALRVSDPTDSAGSNLFANAVRREGSRCVLPEAARASRVENGHYLTSW
jgi:hypothetical protein